MVLKKRPVTKKKKSAAKSKSLPFVIVRSHTAGVHAGYRLSRDGDTVILKDSTRLWQWCGASLSQVAVEGPAPSGTGGGTNKFGLELPINEIVSPQGFEIMHCTPEAKAKILEVPKWRA